MKITITSAQTAKRKASRGVAWLVGLAAVSGLSFLGYNEAANMNQYRQLSPKVTALCQQHKYEEARKLGSNGQETFAWVEEKVDEARTNYVGQIMHRGRYDEAQNLFQLYSGQHAFTAGEIKELASEVKKEQVTLQEFLSHSQECKKTCSCEKYERFTAAYDQKKIPELQSRMSGLRSVITSKAK